MNLLFFFLLSFSLPAFSAKKDVRIQHLWSLKFSSKPLLKLHVVQNTQPLIAGDKVIQGDSFQGLKAFHKKTGRLIWETLISNGGAGSPLVVLQDVIYFGGSDGFFYAVDLKTGGLVWKFFTGSENINSPLVQDQVVYWMASNQKVYAHSLKKDGGLLWMYSGPSLPQGLFARGASGLAVAKGLLYAGFYDGSLAAIDLKSGKRKWSFPKKSIYSISFQLKIEGRCLLAPITGAGLFCLNQLNGKTVWKAPGGSSHPVLDSHTVYQSGQGKIYALEKASGKVLWFREFSGEPVFFSPYREFVVYGSVSDGRIHVADRRSGKEKTSFLFGKGLGLACDYC